MTEAQDNAAIKDCFDACDLTYLTWLVENSAVEVLDMAGLESRYGRPVILALVSLRTGDVLCRTRLVLTCSLK